MSDSHNIYFIPEPSRWPIVGSVALFVSFVGAAIMLNGSHFGAFILGLGIATIIYMFSGWFADVIAESIGGKYNKQVDVSFRWGMSWFIFSEVMFFAAFFGALLYARTLSVPWLAGEGSQAMTGAVLWPEFQASWPLVKTPGGLETQGMGWFGLPLINTILLLTSSITLHFAHLALEQKQRQKLKLFLGATIVLGISFLLLQVEEYIHAYQEMNLRLDSGIYGSTFFMLTGFHGMHVTLGTIMLIVTFFRVLKGHFTPESHFGFQATSWYWHFVDVVWVLLFLFVYII